MTSNPLIVIALVGLALVCVGLFIAAFIFLFRFAGEHSIEFFSFLAHESREAENDKDEERVYSSRKPNLRSIAASEDFDTALARHVVQSEIEPRIVPPTTTPPQTSSPFHDAQPRLGSRGRSQQFRNANPREESGDEFSDLIDDSADR